VELNAISKPTIIAFNKIDGITEDEFIVLKNLTKRYENCVYISAQNNLNMASLENTIVEMLKKNWDDVEVLLPHDAGKLITEIHLKGQIHLEDYQDNGVYIRASLPRELANRLVKYRHENEDNN
jgi:GTP-binding protein HflX